MKKVAKFIQARSEILDMSSGSLSHVIGLTMYKDIEKFRNIVYEWYQKQRHTFGTWIEELKAFAKDNGIEVKVDDFQRYMLNSSDVRKLIK